MILDSFLVRVIYERGFITPMLFGTAEEDALADHCASLRITEQRGGQKVKGSRGQEIVIIQYQNSIAACEA